MRLHLFGLAAGALTLLALTPAESPAQGPDYASYNYQRAYRHFLNSPYSFRTFSSLSPGYASSGYTPYGYESVYVSPGYERQEIGPRQGQYRYYRAPRYASRTVIPYAPEPYYPPADDNPYEAPPETGTVNPYAPEPYSPPSYSNPYITPPQGRTITPYAPGPSYPPGYGNPYIPPPQGRTVTPYAPQPYYPPSYGNPYYGPRR
jgi:hypothetical protein